MRIRRVLRDLPAPRPAGFTLVELLVVIGIIAVLTAVLMPALAAARRAAQMTRCATQLREIANASRLHALDHRGYYQLAGDILVGWKPVHLRDPERVRYTWWRVWGNTDDVIPPYNVALSRYLTSHDLTDITSHGAYMDATMGGDTPIRSWFTCPSARDPVWGMMIHTQGFGISTGVWGETSYVLNEAVLGIDDAKGRARGNPTKVRRHTETFLAADGLRTMGRGTSSLGWYLIANEVYDANPVTLGDAFAGNGRAHGPDSFDLRRHRGRMNVAFLDGHVETPHISQGDLDRVFVQAR